MRVVTQNKLSDDESTEAYFESKNKDKAKDRSYYKNGIEMLEDHYSLCAGLDSNYNE